jgi:acetylornithine deacetylase
MGKLETQDLIAKLISFDTTSALSNLDLINFIADYLDEFGISSIRVFSKDKTKANLIATIGPERDGGVVLSGHTDVVPVAGQTWKTNPFQLSEFNGQLYGRGTSDMKGFIACCLAMVPDLVQRKLSVPVHFTFSYDEEVGCLGARPLLDRFVKDLPRPLLCIVGEPSDMKVANAHRGIATYLTTVTGKPGHSSTPRFGINAINYTIECANFLVSLAAEFRDRAPLPGTEEFDPPFTTINLGRIDGGTATNIIAGQCNLAWDCRTIPGADPEEAINRLNEFVATDLLPRMSKEPAGSDGEIKTELDHAVIPLIPMPGSPAENIVLALTGQNRCTSTPFATEAGMFQDVGIPAVICGPGSAAQAHQPDEFIELSQIEDCMAFLAKLAAWAEQPTG